VAEVAAVIEPVAILPGGETGMTALAAHRELFPSTCTLAACEPGAVAMATDKTALPDLAESAGLRMPQTFEVTEAEVARRLPLHLPVVVKPPRSQVSRDGGFRSLGVQLARTREAVVRALHAMPDGRGLIQRYHPGSLSALAGVVWEGRLVAAVHQRALRTWPTDCGEMSFAVALPRDLDREAGALRLLERVGWSGLFQMQFLDTSEGSMLIDLNPRVYGSLALALGTGQNLPGIWADLLLGREFPVARYRTDVCFRNELLDMYARTVGRRVAGARRLPGPPLPRQTVNAFFESGDPMPLVAVAPIVAAKLYSRRRRAPAVKRAG
jgi:predicted ATP-grasp superfamily ATP-dependent carboligase